ncbi:MAG: single-stranded DNA-binding protein [Candidatus Saccharibacteria bacterium]|nr:single-stranded DNA-binding protein [Candidatus Saccharibacteria bacterium]
MARGFSKAIIVGNLTRDPELRSTAGGTSVCRISVAVSRQYKGNDGDMKDEVSYLDCSAWGKQGETISQYLHKGDPILVSGRLRQNSYEAKDGSKRNSVEIVVEDFNFIGGRGNNDFSSKSSSDASEVPDVVPDDIPEGEIDVDDMPF